MEAWQQHDAIAMPWLVLWYLVALLWPCMEVGSAGVVAMPWSSIVMATQCPAKLLHAMAVPLQRDVKLLQCQSNCVAV